MNSILSAVISLGLLGCAIGVGLAYASKKFHVDRDPRVEAVQKALVGINCGACGYAGCAGAAEAIVKGEAPVDACLPGAEEVAQKVANALGVEYASGKVKQHAVVFCHGTDMIVGKKFRYHGIATCAAAVKMGGGDKACSFGCLGYGDCAAVCNFNAVSLKDGVAVIDGEKCTACLLCVKACPKRIIGMVAAKEQRVVYCRSHDKGAVSRTICSVSCIACSICVKACPFQAINVSNNLAVIDPVKCTNCGICEEKCPTKAIKTS